MNEEKEVKEGNEILLSQLLFYKKHGQKIHIEKTDSRFYNGMILEVEGDLLILEDIKLGAMPIHFIEIAVLEKYKEKEE